MLMGNLSGHMGLINEKCNTNGKMILEFTVSTNLQIKNWELTNPLVWRGRGAEVAID